MPGNRQRLPGLKRGCKTHLGGGCASISCPIEATYSKSNSMLYRIYVACTFTLLPHSLSVRILGFHPRGPGAAPGVGTKRFMSSPLTKDIHIFTRVPPAIFEKCLFSQRNPALTDSVLSANNSVVEYEISNLTTRVRFPFGASYAPWPKRKLRFRRILAFGSNGSSQQILKNPDSVESQTFMLPASSADLVVLYI